MIETWPEGISAAGMPDEMLAPLRDVVLGHPWWEARARLAVRLLRRAGVAPPARVIDAGCGWGTNFLALEREGYRPTGLDVSRTSLEALDAPHRDLVHADLTRDPAKRRPGYAGLLALDVIEHIDDDRSFLRNAASLLAPRGVAIVSVPALPELFSEYDAVQGHRRRYVEHTLRAAFDGTGLDVVSMSFWGCWMVPVLRAQRLLRRPRRTVESPFEVYRSYVALPMWPVPALMRGLYRIEEPLALRGLLPTGTSLFATALRQG